MRKQKYQPPVRAVYLALSVVMLIAMFFAVTVGPMSMSAAQIWGAFTGEASDTVRVIIFDVRAPRMVLAICVGGSLAVAGASMQGLLRNPLADPGLIGVTAGASFAVIFVIVLGGAWLSSLPLVVLSSLYPIAAFIGGVTVTFIVLLTANIGGSSSSGRLILVGVAVTAIVTALIGMIIYLSNDAQLRELTFWTMGSLARGNWNTVVVSSLVMIASSVALFRYRGALDLLQLGERAAFHSGVDVDRVKLQVCTLVAFAVGAGVSVAGPIGFVGLVAPHMTRLFVNARHAIVLPISAMLGAIILLFSDLFVRNAIPPAEIPIGIATSVLGGPFFLWLLLRNSRL